MCACAPAYEYDSADVDSFNEKLTICASGSGRLQRQWISLPETSTVVADIRFFRTTLSVPRNYLDTPFVECNTNGFGNVESITLSAMLPDYVGREQGNVKTDWNDRGPLDFGYVGQDSKEIQIEYISTCLRDRIDKRKKCQYDAFLRNYSQIVFGKYVDDEFKVQVDPQTASAILGKNALFYSGDSQIMVVVSGSPDDVIASPDHPGSNGYVVWRTDEGQTLVSCDFGPSINNPQCRVVARLADDVAIRSVFSLPLLGSESVSAEGIRRFSERLLGK